MTATEAQNVRLVMEHFAAESKHDYEATLATLADDIEYRMIPGGILMRGKSEVTRYYDAWWGAFPDVAIEVQRLTAAGDRVVAESISTATHLGPFMGVPPTGKTVSAHICTLIRVRDGKMIEETVYYDLLERLTQIGSVLELDGHRLALHTPQAPDASCR
jgi:steroid delta-isomerase-like uncharacterized protein